MAAREEIKTKIKDLLHELMGLEQSEIDEDALLYENLGADSIIIVQLYLSCQDYFQVTLADEVNLAEPVSVNSMTETIERKMQQ
ncbi:MAG: hypothetical protein K5705_13280 [Oscillospiraceae bacterium]|nr:hypothetical protein [Oscillospiraceae bacterium]